MSDNLFRISFVNQNAVYEMYAESVCDGIIFGFIEISGLIFGNQTSMVVDPSEERLKAEFEGVSSFMIPMQSVIRIDEVAQRGSAKVKELNTSGNVHTFPGSVFTPKPGSKGSE